MTHISLAQADRHSLLNLMNRHLQLKRKGRFSHLSNFWFHRFHQHPCRAKFLANSALFLELFWKSFDPDHFFSVDHLEALLRVPDPFLNLYIMLVYCHLELTPGSRFQKSSFNKFTHRSLTTAFTTLSLFAYWLVRFLFKEEAFASCTIPPKSYGQSFITFLLFKLRFHHAWSATYQPSLHPVLSPYLNVVQPMSECLVLFSRTHLQR